MDDVGDDERWESGRATIEGAGSAHMNVNNTMLLEADKGPSTNDVQSRLGILATSLLVRISRNLSVLCIPPFFLPPQRGRYLCLVPKLVYQTATDGRVVINKFWFVKGERRVTALAWGFDSWLWFVSVAWRWVTRTLVRLFSN